MRARAAWTAGVVMAALLAGGAASAEDKSLREAANQNPALYVAMYGFSVSEYCNLITEEVYDGFRRETAYLIAKAGLGEEVVRKVRMRAWTDADLEYDNRGLGGFRNWCRTEGLTAARRFVDFRAAQLAAEADERQ